MSEIYVASSSALRDKIDELTNLNKEFRTKADEIRAEQKTLTTKWKGDASTAFQDNFQKEEPNFENFATTIDEYIRALEDILASYEAAEEQNKSIAST